MKGTQKVAKVGSASMAARAFSQTSLVLEEDEEDEEEEEEESQEEEEEETEEEGEGEGEGDRADRQDGVDGGGEALERLAALEDQLAALSEQKISDAEKMTQMTNQIQSMGDEQSAMLKNILESLTGASSGPRVGAKLIHAHPQHGHRHRGGGSAGGRRHTSPSSPSGATSGVQSGRKSPQDTSGRISPSPSRKSVPTMRQQMPADASTASINQVLVKKKIPSMREQMAASVERQRTGSVERSRSPQPQSASPIVTTTSTKKKVMGMLAQMEAHAAQAAGDGADGVAPGPAPSKKRLMGMRAQMEAMAAVQGAAGP